MIIGYSNLSNLLSKIKFFDELSTNKEDKSIKTLKKDYSTNILKGKKNINYDSRFDDG